MLPCHRLSTNANRHGVPSLATRRDNALVKVRQFRPEPISPCAMIATGAEEASPVLAPGGSIHSYANGDTFVRESPLTATNERAENELDGAEFSPRDAKRDAKFKTASRHDITHGTRGRDVCAGTREFGHQWKIQRATLETTLSRLP